MTARRRGESALFETLFPQRFPVRIPDKISCPRAANAQRRRRVPNRLRVISRPAAVAAERRKLLTAGLRMIRSAAVSSRPALGETPGAAGACGFSGATAAIFAARISDADSRSMVWRYFADNPPASAREEMADSPMVSMSERGGTILVHATGVG